MPLATKNQKQASAIGEIATLLHVQRQGVASLISRVNDPLPLPASHEAGEHFILDSHYKYKLLCWVQKARSQKNCDELASLDFNRIEHELEAMTSPKHWSIEDELNQQIPEIYLG